MPNPAYFEVTADGLERAKKFSGELPGREFSKPRDMNTAMEYREITAGKPEEGTINRGGLYQRQSGPDNGSSPAQRSMISTKRSQ